MTEQTDRQTDLLELVDRQLTDINAADIMPRRFDIACCLRLTRVAR